MRFLRKGPDVAEVESCDGTRVLYSYGQAVALWSARRAPYSVGPRGFVRVKGYTSRTTERHIREFVGAMPAEQLPPPELVLLAQQAC